MNRQRIFLGLATGAMMGIALATGNPGAAAPAPTYTLAKTVPLGAPDHWDYVIFSPSHGRVYAAHGSEVTVLDGATGQILGELTGLEDSHGVAPVPSAGRVYADSGKNHMIYAYDAKTFDRINNGAPVVADADGMTYVPQTDEVIVVGGDAKAATAIKGTTGSVLATIRLDGKPEGVDRGAGGLVYVAIEDKRLINRVDTKTNTVTARWPIPSCAKPHGMAVDRAHKRLFVSCENGIMLAVDSHDGKVLARLPIGKHSDSAAFDPHTQRAISSNGDGTLSVVQETPAGAFVDLGTVATEPGARTMAVDPATGRIFTMTAAVAQGPSAATSGGRRRFKPGTLHMLFYDPHHGP